MTRDIHRYQALAISSAIIFCAIWGVGAANAQTPVPDSQDWAFVTLVNNFRAQNGVGPLQVSVGLQTAAQWMASDMASKNYLSHTDSLGRSTGQRLAALGYPYLPWGEDLASGFASAQSVFAGFQNACDPDGSGNCTYAHRSIMLGSGYLVIGIANANGYWAADFGGVVDQVINPNSPTGPTIGSFTASPNSISSGQSTTLSWTVTGATSVSINNGVGNVAAAGSQNISPAQTTTYTLTATNSSGTATASATVTVSSSRNIIPTAPVLTSATARSSSEVDLTWTASTDSLGISAYQIFRNGAAIASVSGAATTYADTGLAPSTTYTYAVQATDNARNVSALSNTLQATTNATTVNGQSCPPPATGSFTGCYYPNTTLTGNPTLVRTDSQINFDWGSTAPDSSLRAGSYSAGWAGYFAFTTGSYTFSVTASDGVRLYIDGTLVMDHWINESATNYAVTESLSAGTHLIGLQYYDQTQAATVHLTWQSATTVSQVPTILSFTGNPSSVTWGQTSSLSWSVNGATSVSIDNGVGDVTSVLGKRVTLQTTTTYTLTATNSAGSSHATVVVSVASVADTQAPSAPLLVSAIAKSSSEVDLTWAASSDNVGVTGYQITRNGVLVASVNGSTTTYADQSATASSTYTYTVTAFDAAGNFSRASNTLQAITPANGGSGGGSGPGSGNCPAPAVGAFTGCYFNNLTMSGNPVFTRTDNQLNFDWGSGSPNSAVTPGNFSAQWQGYFTFSDGVYAFTAVASDGIRVFIDGNPVLNAWQNQPLFMFQARPTLTQGTHLVRVEYYEATGSAAAHLTWNQY